MLQNWPYPFKNCGQYTGCFIMMVPPLKNTSRYATPISNTPFCRELNSALGDTLLTLLSAIERKWQTKNQDPFQIFDFSSKFHHF